MLYFKAVIEGADVGVCFRAGFPQEDRMEEELNKNTWEAKMLKKSSGKVTAKQKDTAGQFTVVHFQRQKKYVKTASNTEERTT